MTATSEERADATDDAAVVFCGVGAELRTFELDTTSGSLAPAAHLAVAGRVQEGCVHPALPVLYVACGDRDATEFSLHALSFDRRGGLALLGPAVPIAARAIDVTVDAAGTVLLTAHNDAPGVTVHLLSPDGGIAREVPLPEGFSYGDHPHHVHAVPGRPRAILVDRGHTGDDGPEATSGVVNLIGTEDGRLENLASVDMTGAPGLAAFNPRAVDFHPTLPFVYASLEQQNQLAVLRLDGDDLTGEPSWTRELLADRAHMDHRQLAGTVLVHPSGRTLYVTNRGDGPFLGHVRWMTPESLPLFERGENTVAVFALDDGGEPTLVQLEGTRGISPRTSALTPDGNYLVVANSKPMRVAVPGGEEVVPASLAVFGIAPDGRLAYRRKLDVDVGRETLWWAAIA